MKLLVRLDDITADMDMSRFLRIKDILDKYNIKPLIGVVPDNHDDNLHYEDNNPDFWNLINMLISEKWVVSQHGYKHTYCTGESGLLGINPYSEFAGITYAKQLEALSSGQGILLSHGISPEIFMAPAHSFDSNTLNALKELGFKAVTDGLYKKPYIREGLLFIPCRFLGNKCDDFDTLCIHSNTISENSISDLENLLKRKDICFINWNIDELKSKAIPYNIYIWIYERIAVFKRRLRSFAANNDRFSKYMIRTNSRNKAIKVIKRIILLPSLLLPLRNKR